MVRTALLCGQLSVLWCLGVDKPNQCCKKALLAERSGFGRTVSVSHDDAWGAHPKSERFVWVLGRVVVVSISACIVRPLDGDNKARIKACML